jgi:hypothetical protein
MGGPRPETGFSLSYELQPGDLAEMIGASPRVKRSRTRNLFTVVLWALLGVAFTAITIALNHPSVVKDSHGAPSWMYVIDGVIWVLVFAGAILVWRTNPKRLARRTWRNNHRLHGRNHDEIDSRGVTWTSPDGSQAFIPWATLARVRETDRAFVLQDDDGDGLAVLPKRGLHNPELIPALREFLNRSAGELSAAAPERF